MGYMHIDNLYKDTALLRLCREVFALEKIHGTSAHVTYHTDKAGGLERISYFSGGSPRDTFTALFDATKLDELFRKKFETSPLSETTLTVFGEAYGGKLQGMKETYGDTLKFIAFEVQIGDTFLDVENAYKVALELGYEFVDWVKGPADLSFLDEQRDRPSLQAFRNGCGADKRREGIVIRPVIELVRSNGKRLIAKHKCVEFSETKTPRDVGAKLEILAQADKIANEWVTEARLNHVMDLVARYVGDLDMKHTGVIIKTMLEDVLREGAGEIVDSKDARKAIGHQAALMFKRRIMEVQSDTGSSVDNRSGIAVPSVVGDGEPIAAAA